uniref:Uncharacterized protein n=1 Tax=Panagrolaimus sp. ES5 TaxID=591445 RepID=A0AC34GW20_9BILA
MPSAATAGVGSQGTNTTATLLTPVTSNGNDILENNVSPSSPKKPKAATNSTTKNGRSQKRAYLKVKYDDLHPLLDAGRNTNLSKNTSKEEIEDKELFNAKPVKVPHTSKELFETSHKIPKEMDETYDDAIANVGEYLRNNNDMDEDDKIDIPSSSTPTLESNFNEDVPSIDNGLNVATIVPDILFNKTATHVITIGQKFVAIYDRRIKKSDTIPAAIDYGKNPSKIGVTYVSSTVITSSNYFNDDNIFPKEEIYDTKEYRQYFVISDENSTKKINKNRIIFDLLKEAADRIDSKTIILTIPWHFSTAKIELFEDAAKVAGFDDTQILDETLALCYGIKKNCGIKDTFILIDKNQLKTKILLFDNEISRQKVIDSDKSDFDVDLWYDNIICEAEIGECASNNKNLKYADSVFGIIDSFQNQNHPATLVIALIGNPLLNMLKDKYLTMSFILIKIREQIITKGVETLFD